MARPIDEKIVAMKMDNSDLKKKAVESSSVIGKLMGALNKIPGVNMGKVVDSFSGIQKAAQSVDMSGIAKSVDDIAGRFSSLNVMATTALVNISNRAVNAGLALADSLGPAQVRGGFEEYELKMKSIQTILANTQNKGSTLADVKRNFEDLNKYADKTIYSFADMTKNIGLFTNAGLELDESTQMIKGFSNAAAASGAGAEETARAAYQLSQGLSAGYIMQMDWMSLTNAGMGNDNMKRDLIALGKAHGTLSKKISDDQAIKDWKSLLTDEKWLTSEVMSDYLRGMAGDLSEAELRSKGLTKEQAKLLVQNAKTGEDAATKVRTFTQMMDTLKEGIGSGWAESFELIFGDFEEATKMWSGLSEAIGSIFQRSTDSRNAIIRMLSEAGFFKGIFKGITAIFSTLDKIIGAVGKGFKAAFGALSVDGLKKAGEGIKNFFSAFKPSQATLDKLSTVVQAIVSVFKVFGAVALAVGKILVSLIPDGLVGGILSVLEYVSKLVIAFTDSVLAGKKVKSSAGGMGDIFGTLGSVLGKVLKGFESLDGVAQKVYDSFGDASALDKAIEMFKTFDGVIKEVFSIFAKGDYIGTGPWDEDSKIIDWLFDIREAFQAFGEYLGNIEWSLAPVTAAFGAFFGVLKKGFDWVVGKLSEVGAAIKEHLPSGRELFAGGFLAGLVAVTAMIVKVFWDFTRGFGGFAQLGDSLSEVLEGAGNALNGFAMQVKANALMLIAVALGILAAALFVISKIDGDKLVSSLLGLGVTMQLLVGSFILLSKADFTGRVTATAIQMVALSIAFSILAGALKKISNLNWNEIAKGVVGLTATIGTFAGAVVLMSKFGGPNMVASAGQMLAIAGTVYILALALKKIGKMDGSDIAKGIAGIGSALLIFGGVITMMSKFGKGAVGASALQILAIAGSVVILVQAIKMIAKLDYKELGTGLVTIGLILGAIAGFTRLTKGAGLASSGAGIMMLAIALNMMIIPIAALGSMNITTLVKGLGAMAVALVAIGAASMLMKGMIASGAGLMLMAIALNMLVIPIAALGAMSWGALIKGVVGIGLGLAVLGAVALLLTPAVLPLLGFAAAIALMGIAMLAAGAGMALFATGLATLAGLTLASVTSIIAVMGTFIAGLTTLIPTAVEFIVKLMVQIATAIETNAPIIGQKMYNTMLGILAVIEENIPKIAAAVTAIIVAMLTAIGENQPKVVLAATDMIIAMIDGLANAVEQNGPRFIASIQNLMAQIMIVIVQAGVAIIQALFGWIPGVNAAAADIGNNAEQKIRETLNAQKAGSDKGAEFATSLGAKAGAAKGAGASVGNSAKQGANGADLKTVGSNKGSDFATQLANKAGAARGSGEDIANAGKQGAGSVSMGGTGENFGLGFAGGINSGTVMSSVASAALSIAQKAKNTVAGWLDMHSPSRLMFKDGEFFTEGFALGIEDKAKMVGDKAKGVAQTAKDTLNRFMQGFELPDGENELHFKAVIDYDALDTGRFGAASIGVIPDTSVSANLVPARVTPEPAFAQFSQNGDNSALIGKQDEQIQMLKEQNRILTGIHNKDNSVYLDGKELHRNNQKIEKNETFIRNVFKGVPTA